MTAPPVSVKRILSIALPALATLAADPVLSLVDTAFVGRLGTVPLAALGVDTAIFSFAYAIFNFLAYATTPMVARARGQGDVAQSGRIVWGAMSLAVVIGVVSVLVLLAGARFFVVGMQAGSAVVDPAVSYLRIRAFALPAVLIITAANGAYRGFENTRVPLYVTLVINVLNVILNPVLMFWAGLGIQGAAWATLVAQWVGAIGFWLLLRRKSRAEDWAGGRLTGSDLVPFLRAGPVLILRTLLLVASLTVATAVAADTGTVEVAAHQVVSQLWFLLAMMVDALAIAAQSLIASTLGGGEPARAKALADKLIRWGLVVGVGLAAVLLALRNSAGVLFTDDPAVLAALATAVPIAALMQPAAAVLFVLDGVFLATLSVRLLAKSTFAGFVAISVVLTLTVQLGWGLAGVWWGITAMVLGRLAVLGTAYVRSGLNT